MNTQLSSKEICRILVKNALISESTTKQIFEKEPGITQKLEKLQDHKASLSTRGNKIIYPVSIIDVIVYLDLKRDDNTSWPLDEEAIYQALAKEWNISYKKIDPLKLDLNVVTTTVPRNFAMKHTVLPIAINDGVLIIATPNPFDMEIIEDIAHVSNMKVKPVVSTKSDIIKCINEFFGFKRSIAAAEDMFASTSVDIGNLEQYVKLSSGDELPHTDQHIVNAVTHLFLYAFDQRASDIHIEPKRKEVLVRMRIDGVLHTVYRLPKKVHNAIVSRIKALSRLDMAEKRKPQDGRIKTDKGDVEVEIRISTVPVAFGEKVVMRIMDPDVIFLDLMDLGFTSKDLNRYVQFISKPHGIVLVCGPTGSGKSTTLYSTLRKLSTSEKNIITVEDPIEMVHEDFNQIAVRPAVGITFGTILRTILRQDPDIIMIGEMRDTETAESAIQAALTGHLVLSTLHTNDAASVITRLIDLGIASFMIQATLVGILAQRLVRKICKYCSVTISVNKSKLSQLGINIDNRQYNNGKLKLSKGKGCSRCRGTGYHGRTSLFEVLPYTESIRGNTLPATDLETIKNIATKDGMISLRENAITKMLNRETTYQEVLRVTQAQ